jgi:hypothetical protein
MKTVVTVAVLGLAACWTALAVAEHHEDHLAEMKKCSVCKCLAEKPELMKDMIWETHKIDSGMLCVASVPKEQAKEFEAVQKEMMKNVEKVKADQQAGKPVELCAFCAGFGELEKAGAKHQEIKTATGGISLLTSNDPTVVAKIHEQADKAIAEQKKMAAEHNQVSATN